MEKDSLSKEWEGENLIFLISQPRSGSTLLQRLINGHPEVHSVAEPWIMLHPLYALKQEGVITDYDSSLARQGLGDFLSQIPEGEELYIKALRKFGSILYNNIITLSGKKYFLDKTPRYYNIIPELYRVFTNAKFIFLYRNPLAIMSSILSSWCGNNPEILKNSLGYNDLTKGPKYLTEGAKLLGEKGIVVHYEDLVKHPKEVIQDICAKIGIDYHENMLEYGLNQSPKGSFGDPIIINNHSRSVTDYVDKWIENISEPELIDFANEYLSSLGPSLVSAMGYSYQEMKEKLNAPIDLKNQSKKQIKKSQQKLSKPNFDKEQNTMVVATSLAPRDIEIQAKAVESWITLGFKVFSINCEEEIDLIKKSFPQVNFIKAKRNGKKIFGKPYIYFDDFIHFFKKIDSEICGIINSDNILISEKGIVSFIQKQAKNSLVYGSRVEIKSLDNLDGEFYDRGFDFFFFDKSILSCFPESEACIGVTWWDYWTAAIPILEGIEIKKLVSPFAYHITHQNRWDENQWHYMGEQISSFIYKRRCENNKIQTNKNPWKIFDAILFNATHSYFLNRKLGSEERIKNSYGMLTHVAFSILVLLEKMSKLIKYNSTNYSQIKRNKQTLLFNGNYIARDLNEKGEQLLKKKDLKGALKHFFKCIEIEPVFSKAHSNLGLTYWKIGDLTKALEHFKSSLKMEPKDEIATLYCSNILKKSGKYEEARILYSYYLQHDPGNFKIGKLLAKLEGKKLSTMKSSRKVIETNHQFELGQAKNFLQKHSGIKVTAVVSTYNSENFIRGCLKDLTTQTISDQIEIIIIDSGSQQNEGVIVKEYQKKYKNIKYIKTKKRETVYAAWNRGIKKATGKYITNANTDDRHRKDAFEIMVQTLEQHPNVALVYADVLITEKENETFENCTPVGTFQWLEWKREDLLKRGCFIGPQPMWRKVLHEEYGYFDETLVTSGDYEYWLRISQTHKFLHLPVFLGLYLRSPNSIEHRNRKIQVIENNRIIKMYKNATLKEKVIRRSLKDNKLQRSICKVSLETKEKNILPAKLYKEIISEFSFNKPETTQKKLEKLLLEYPEYALAQNDLGVLYNQQGLHKMALKRYKRAVNLEPGNTTFRKNLADLLAVKYRKYEEALQHYITVLASEPNDVEALTSTGHICAHLERFNDAAEFYERVIEIEPDNSDAKNWLTKMVEKASANCMEVNLNDRYLALLSEIDQEDLAGAIKKIENFIELYPKHGQAHNDLGVFYYKNESKTKVLEHYFKAVELEMENVTFRKNLADFLYVEEGRVEEALENYVEVLRIKPDDVETLLITGHICTAIERYEDAMSFYNKVLIFEPQNLDARQNLKALEKLQISKLYQDARGEEKPDDDREINQVEPHGSVDEDPIVQAGVVEDLINKADLLFQQERIDQAVDAMLKVIAVNPSDGRTYVELAGQLVNHGHHKNALEVLAEMPANQPETLAKQKLLLKGYAEEGLGDYATAEKYCDRVFDRDPENAKALNLRGILAYRQGDKETAEQHFKRAIELNLDYGESHTNLGALVWEKGETKEALKFYEQGFLISPTDIDVANAYHEAVSATGEYIRAEKIARRALKKYPRCRKVRYLLIDSLIRQEKTESALKELEAAIATLGIGEGLLDTALNFSNRVGNNKKSGSSKKPVVSLCMIVKDEEDNLATCLASVKPIVHEMIVVDTGSTDRTKEIAEFFGARVYDYKWGDDFAEARNFSLSKARGAWILILDADEVISSNDYEKFRSIIRRRPQKSIAYSLTTRNYCTLANTVGWMPNDGKYHREEASNGWVPSVKVRLFYGMDRIWFEGAVHEMVETVLKRNEIPIKQCHIPIHHYGRLNLEKLERKGEKYFEIGKKKLATMGDNINAIREMAIQAAVLDKNEEAIELWQKFLYLDPSPGLASEALINLGTIYNRLGKFDDAFQASKRALELTPEVKEAHNNYALGKFYLGNVEQAIPIFEELLNKFPGYLSAQFKLAAAYCCNGQEEKGKKTFEMLRETVKMGYKEMAGACHDLAKGLVSAQMFDYAIGLLNASIENNYVNDDLLNLLTECLNKKNETRSVGKIFRKSLGIHSGRDISAQPFG